MKKITILFALIAVSIYGLKAQNISQSSTQYNGNIYHLGGNVGVKTNTPLVPLQINASTYTDNMTLGTATGGFSLTGTNGLYGLFSGVSSDGHVWMQVGRNDVSTATYPLTLQTQGGNVGIGTTTPSYQLSIVNSTSSTTAYKLWAGRSVSSEGLGFAVDDNGAYIKSVQDETGTESHGLTFDVVSAATGDHYIRFSTNGSEKMRINSSGKIGIGTTTPVANLQIGGSTENGLLNLGSYSFVGCLRSSGDIFMGYNVYAKYSSSTENSIIKTYQANLPSISSVLFNQNGDINFYQKTSGLVADQQVNVASNSTVVFKGNGNVGIGTTSPLYKLSVKGTIGCGEVKVEDVSSWPDFVFHPTYKLRTLGEVEQFIKTNNHLPEIPTESEVKQNGIGLGEMNAKLLQKIEELTLYMIEQNKKMEQQQKEINELKELNMKLAIGLERINDNQ